MDIMEQNYEEIKDPHFIFNGPKFEPKADSMVQIVGESDSPK